MEKAQAAAEANGASDGNGAGGGQVLELPVAAPAERPRLDEDASPTAGRRFKRG